jgi:hypothetical protein
MPTIDITAAESPNDPDQDESEMLSNQACDDFTAVYLGHIWAYSFGERHGLPGLKEQAQPQLITLLDSVRFYAARSGDVIPLIRLIYARGLGRSFSVVDAVARFCARHFDHFGKMPRFVELLTEFPDFLGDFMSRLADEFDRLRANNKEKEELVEEGNE